MGLLPEPTASLTFAPADPSQLAGLCEFSAHSMRATFITTALENGAPSSRTCKRPPGTAIQAQPNCMIGADTTRRRRRRFLQPINVQAKASPPQNIASWDGLRSTQNGSDTAVRSAVSGIPTANTVSAAAAAAANVRKAELYPK